jgi:hypothetical protein
VPSSKDTDKGEGRLHLGLVKVCVVGAGAGGIINMPGLGARL